MGQKSYLRVDGIRGSSFDLGHVGDLELSQFSYVSNGKSKSENVKVSILMELEPSFGVFYDKMMHNQKLKDATLTIESRDRFNVLVQTYKAEMKGLKVTEVSSGAIDFHNPKEQPWPIQKVSFLVDSVEVPRAVRSVESNDQWKAS